MSSFSNDMLELNCGKELEKISDFLQNVVRKKFRKRGIVVALSGGIDSSVVGAICTHALGKDKVFGLLLPEKESSPDSTRLGKMITKFLGIEAIEEDITPLLEAAGCYSRRDKAIKSLIPKYDSSYKCKIVLPNMFESKKYNIFFVVSQSPEGEVKQARLTPQTFLEIVAATNFKQRIRKMLEYYHADRLNYAVSGTPNRQEYDQGFFVKLGDGAADVKPIAHLYKTQVYQMAEYLKIPAEIRASTPTTDTYSMPQTQEEFYFSVPYDKFDYCLYGKNNSIPAAKVAEVIGFKEEDVKQIYSDIDQKRTATRYLHASPVLIENILEINKK